MLRGEIDLESMQELRSKFCIDYIITGSVDEFEPGRGALRWFNPSVEMSIKSLWTGGNSVTGLKYGRSNGQEHESLFGLGREYSLSNLATRQIGTLLQALAIIQNENRKGCQK